MGFNLGGVFKSLVNPATLMQLAMGPAGWASIAMKAIGTAIAQQFIQQIGQRLGLPPAVINLAQQAFAAGTGQPGGQVQSIAQAVSQVAQQFGMSPVQAGQLQQAANAAVDRMVSGFRAPSADEQEEGGTSFLVALAKAMGKLMDAKAAQMQKVSTEISQAVDGNGKLDQSEQTKLSSKTALLQAYGQELSILSNAFSQTAKSFGEANTTNARKG